MSTYRSTVLALALLGALAPRLGAQEGIMIFEPARRAWLGFSYERTETRRPGETTLTLGVVSVVDSSPAAQAGLRKGDTILRINNLGASQELLGSLGTSMNPGDTVVFRIRRDGREQDLTIIAAKPPADYANRLTVRVRPDSVRQLVRIFTDSMKKNMDSTVFQYLAQDSALRHFYLQRDSLLPRLLDSTRFQVYRRGRLDSAFVRFQGDSMVWFGPESRAFVFGGRQPGEGAAWSIAVGFRAVAGAELQELNPELARYFEVDDGLLVVNAAQGSPARRAGLQAGDVITAADGEAVTTIAQLRRAVERARGGAVKLEVVREGEKRAVELPR